MWESLPLRYFFPTTSIIRKYEKRSSTLFNYQFICSMLHPAGVISTFIPRREKRSGSNGVHLTVFPFYMSLVNRNWGSKNTMEYPCFFDTRKPLLSGWVGGDQKGPSIFLIFRYINKQCLLISNMVSKSVYGFYIKSYEHFTF